MMKKLELARLERRVDAHLRAQANLILTILRSDLTEEELAELGRRIGGLNSFKEVKKIKRELTALSRSRRSSSFSAI